MIGTAKAGVLPATKLEGHWLTKGRNIRYPCVRSESVLSSTSDETGFRYAIGSGPG